MRVDLEKYKQKEVCNASVKRGNYWQDFLIIFMVYTVEAKLIRLMFRIICKVCCFDG